VVHQFPQDVHGGSGVCVALGVGVAEGVGVDQGPVEGQGVAAGVDSFGVRAGKESTQARRVSLM